MKTPRSIHLLGRNPFSRCVVATGSMLFVLAQGGTAATILVDSSSDSGPGTLRAAITAANANADADIIKIAFAGTIQLASALPSLSHEVQIVGLKATANTVQPANGVQCRIFTVGEGATVTISDLTIRNGIRTSTFVGGPGQGGGIYNAGTLTLLRCEVRGNQAIGSNNLQGTGGAGRGGGIHNNIGATLTVDHCTVAGNTAKGGASSSVSGTGAHGYGAGIYNNGVLTIRSSTISGNAAVGGSGSTAGLGLGGGLYTDDSPPTNPVLISSTVCNNSANTGGGLNTYNMAFRVRSSILAGNLAPLGPECWGPIHSEDYNLIENTSGCTLNGETTHSQINKESYLGPLQDNGGPTRTHALAIDSPARDNGDDTIVSAPENITTDQRLLTRQDGGVDIGAVEAAASPVPPGDFNGDERTDYALVRPSDRKTAIWYLANPAFTGSSYGPTLPADWQVVDCGDFNKDAQSDYLLFNSVTRRTATWFMANATLIGGAFGPNIPDGWTLIGAANFIADTKREWLLVRPATGQTAIWIVDGATVLAPKFGPTIPSGWSLVDAADFGGNPLYDDYLLYNPATRKTAVWLLDASNGYTVAEHLYGPTVPAGWSLVGADDFGGGAKIDYVLFNPGTRETAIWYLNGTAFINGVYGPTLPSGWQLVSP